MNVEFSVRKIKKLFLILFFGPQSVVLVVKLIKIFLKMKSSLKDNYSNSFQDDFSSDTQSLFFGGALVFFNLSVMILVGLYWMNPGMHQFISGRPLL